MRALVYLSGHGFGHAARTTQVVNALVDAAPATEVYVRTTVPEWFLRASLQTPFTLLQGVTDTGVVQPDSLSIDEADTAARAAAFYAQFDSHVDEEFRLINGIRPHVVVADIPPVAFAAAAAAGVPSVAVSNFTWDWIYGGFPAFDAQAPGVRATIARANAQATLALRLPFHGGFETVPRIEDAPLVARRPVVGREVTRARLGLQAERPLVLATFGGHGGNVPLRDAADDGRFVVVATDYEVGTGQAPHPNLRVVSGDTLKQQGLTYTDLLGACDVVATKLGYGIVSECLASGVPLLYTVRGRFVEQDVFVRELPGVLRCRTVAPDALRAGRWGDDVEALLAQPTPTQTLRTDGARWIAERIVRECWRR